MTWKPEDAWEISCSTTEKVTERVRRPTAVFFYNAMLKNLKPVALLLCSHQSLCPIDRYIY
jgi:hypothetical protein